MVFAYHLHIRERPGKLGRYVFWILFSVYVATLLILPLIINMNVKSCPHHHHHVTELHGGFPSILNQNGCELRSSLRQSNSSFVYFDVVFISSTGYITFMQRNCVPMLLLYIAIGFSIACFSIKILRCIAGSIELQQDDEWIFYLVLYLLQGLIEIQWNPTLLLLVSLLFCAIVSTITEGWSKDQTGFVNLVAAIYLNLFSNKHEDEIWIISMVLLVTTYSKVTESILKRFFLMLGLNFNDQLVVEDNNNRAEDNVEEEAAAAAQEVVEGAVGQGIDQQIRDA